MVGRAQCYSSWGNVELSLLARLDVLASSRPHLKASAWARWPVLGSAVVVRGGGGSGGGVVEVASGVGGSGKCAGRRRLEDHHLSCFSQRYTTAVIVVRKV